MYVFIFKVTGSVTCKKKMAAGRHVPKVEESQARPGPHNFHSLGLKCFNLLFAGLFYELVYIYV